LTHTPLIITYHQDVHLQGIIGIVERFLRYTVGKATLRSAQRVLFTTQDYGQNSYIRPLLHGRENHIGELPNGVDTQVFTPCPASEGLRQRYLLVNEDRVAILVAGLDTPHYFKGVDIFIASLVELPTNFKAIIIGDGDLRPAYERQASNMGVKERVHFIGRVSDIDLPGYYRLADVTVLPSVTMGEAFGLVLVESMACGTPVIASNLPGVRKVVEIGVDGYLMKPGDVEDLRAKLQQILSMPELQRAEMGAAGRRKVEQNYTWELVGQRLEAIYQQVILKCAGTAMPGTTCPQ
jgi:glycosyltransferase involved in cell wall biosynthesis